MQYVVDTVSRDGDHKCMGIWVYDKRPANGAGEHMQMASQLTAML